MKCSIRNKIEDRGIQRGVNSSGGMSIWFKVYLTYKQQVAGQPLPRASPARGVGKS